APGSSGLDLRRTRLIRTPTPRAPARIVSQARQHGLPLRRSRAPTLLPLRSSPGCAARHIRRARLWPATRDPALVLPPLSRVAQTTGQSAPVSATQPIFECRLYACTTSLDLLELGYFIPQLLFAELLPLRGD